MFKSIQVKNGFYDKDDVFLSFDSGLNVITAKNGSGKSHTLECLNYSLFGVQALRSSIQDYKEGFSVEAVVSLGEGFSAELRGIPKGNLYKIRRNSKSAKLFIYDTEEDDWELLVTGITAVNNHIKELLSYDFKIYGLTNYCSQAGLLDLTEATPATLVHLIDTIAGVEVSEALESYLKDRLTRTKSDRKGLENTRDNYNKDLIDVEFKEDLELEKHLDGKGNVLYNPSKIVKDLREQNDLAKSFLTLSKEIFKTYNQSQVDMERLRDYEDIPIDVLTESLKAIQEATVKRNTLVTQIKRISVPREEYSLEDLEYQEKLIEDNKAYDQYVKIKKQIEEHKLTCPNCNYEFYNTDLELEGSFEEEPSKPVLTSAEINVGKRWLEDRGTFLELKREVKELDKFLMDNLSISELDEQISNYKSFVEAREHLIKSRGKLDVFLKEIQSADIFKPLLKEGVPSDLQEIFVPYTEALISQNDIEINEMEDLSKRLVSYAANRKAFYAIKKFLDDVEGRLSTYNSKVDILNVLFNTLKESKRHVQSEGLPVVSNLASSLLSTMTNGERASLVIDKDFNISLDGNSVKVAEMSAQVIANVALRFGLLNTFHKDSLNLFIGDEIDSPLHEDRFSYLETCLQNLVGLGYQIILVSHKDFGYGNVIDLHKT